MSGPVTHCRAFGLTLQTCLPLPDLLPADAGQNPDVVIVDGEVPVALPDAGGRGVCFDAAPSRLLLRVKRVARYLVEEGRRVTIARERTATDEEVALFLLGPVMGALLQQRGDLVLHGSAIVAADSGVAFLGVAGTGKSTLAAAFSRRGHRVLADDHCVLRASPDRGLLVHPAFPLLKLWPDSLRQLELAARLTRRLRLGVNKRALVLGAEFASDTVPLRKIYVLSPSNRDELSLTPIEGLRRFNVLRSHLYRARFLTGTNPQHFQHLLALATQATLVLVKRPRSPFRLEELERLIAENLCT